MREAYIGSLPPPDGRWETWALNAEQSPYPIVYVLEDIGTLITSDYITTVTTRNLSLIQNNLYQAFSAYCAGNLTGTTILPLMCQRFEYLLLTLQKAFLAVLTCFKLAGFVEYRLTFNLNYILAGCSYLITLFCTLLTRLFLNYC